ncbi:MAG TPA: protein kinase [Methylomirabilota bacterium]|nr:protein kinase [Methylomirabilota bacterium]
MARLQPGATLSHYRILETLGEGGQATAYKALDLRLSRLVVIKILQSDLAASEAARRRFDREARLCSALDHPNICAVHDVGEEEGLCYIVMQFVEGRTLRQLVAGRSLELLGALSIAIQVADALAAAHARGIAHRDVKPANVIVRPGGQVTVLDFGLAKLLAGEDAAPRGRGPDEPVTELGVPYGSLGYGSPEQVSGDRVDHRTDLFSLGVVIYEMVTGQPPFRGRNRLEVLRAVVHDTPRPLAELRPGAPPRLQAILDRALAKDPRDRFPSMAAMRDELKAVMRQLTHETGLVPTETSATLVVPRRARSSWLLSGRLGRAFGRFRSGAGGYTPRPAADAGIGDRAARPAPWRPPSWGTETRRTVAVLPFKNLSGDPDANFYEVSLADAIITELAHLRSLVVRPSSYIAHYAGQPIDPRRVGDELAVAAVLIGSFIKGPDRFRVTAQFIATATGEILWSDKIDVRARDLITIQDTIAERVIDGLRLRLTAEEQERLERPLTRNAEAYECYLRGRDLLLQYILRTFDDADLDEAIGRFREALGRDPEFALAHAALGRCYVHHAQGYGGADYYRRAAAALGQALVLDPALVDARLQMVHVFLHRGDKDRAHATIAELRREAPNDPAVIFDAAMLYRLDGLYEKALHEYDRLLEINPRDIVIASYSRARVYTHQHQYERAIAELERARAVEPDHPLAKTFLAVAYFNQGRVDEAQPLVEEVLRQHPHLEGVKPVLAWCLSARGEHERARALITEGVKETAEADHDTAFWLAGFYALEGMADEAIDWVRRAIRLGNENYPLFADSRKLDRLRADPRFVELMAELKQRWEARRE